MMNLHELNQVLIGRGMPKHEYLVWVENEDETGVHAPEWHLCYNDTGRPIDSEIEPVIIDPSVLSESIAADLIAMHALRWRNRQRPRHALDNGVASRGNALRTLRRIVKDTEPRTQGCVVVE